MCSKENPNNQLLLVGHGENTMTMSHTDGPRYQIASSVHSVCLAVTHVKMNDAFVRQQQSLSIADLSSGLLLNSQGLRISRRIQRIPFHVQVVLETHSNLARSYFCRIFFSLVSSVPSFSIVHLILFFDFKYPEILTILLTLFLLTMIGWFIPNPFGDLLCPSAPKESSKFSHISRAFVSNTAGQNQLSKPLKPISHRVFRETL